MILLVTLDHVSICYEKRASMHSYLAQKLQAPQTRDARGVINIVVVLAILNQRRTQIGVVLAAAELSKWTCACGEAFARGLVNSISSDVFGIHSCDGSW